MHMPTPYDNVNPEGFGAGSWAHVEALKKALEAGYAVSGQTGGNALQVQSLEQTLKLTQHTDRHLAFWHAIPKTKAYSLTEEYTRLDGYGDDRASGFVAQGALPETEDSTYSRQSAFVKFMGEVGSVSHQMTMVRTIGGDPIVRETQNRILNLLRRLDSALFFGNSKLGFNGAEGLEFDGLQSLIPSSNIIDLQNQPLEERAIRDGAQTILDNFGVPSHLIAQPKQLEDYAKSYIPNFRVPVQNGDGSFTAGFVPNKVSTVAGEVSLLGDLFLKRFADAPSAATHAEAPTAPASVSGSKSGGADGGEWAKQSTTSTISAEYRVTACNDKGESTAATSSAVTISTSESTKSITLTITNAASVAVKPLYFNIYRRDGGSGSFYRVARVAAASQASGGTTTWKDVNLIIAGTWEAYMLDMRPEVIEFRQLLDLAKMDLAFVGPAYRFMVLLYGVPVLYTPKKAVRFINVAAAS